MKKFCFLLAFAALLECGAFSQSHITNQPHQKVITQITTANSNNSDGSYFTVSEDGFIIKWNSKNEGEHYQVSNLWIKNVAVAPNGTDVAIYETDGGSINIVSVWDWKKLTKKFQKKYTDTITSLNYSAKGTYLIVGTSSMDGAEFIKASSYSVEKNKLKQTTNIVNYIATSDTEKTATFYSTSGYLSYFSMQNGELKQKVNTLQGLTQTVLYNNSKFFAGVKGRQVFIINSMKGNTISTVNGNSPVIVTNSKDNDLYYVDYDGVSKYTLYRLPSTEKNTIGTIDIVKVFTAPAGLKNITTGKKIDTKNETTFVFGTQDGNILKISGETSGTVEKPVNVTEKNFVTIKDVQASKNSDEIYFLTDKALFKTSYASQTAEKIIDAQGHTNFIVYNESIIMWTAETPKSVISYDLQSKKTTNLFKPENNIQTIKFCSNGTNDYLIEIERTGAVNVYDFASKKLKMAYSGTGIQDAIIAQDGNLYIAKSAMTHPNTPLLKVNLKTLETVPSKLDGTIMFGLGLSADKKTIYGIIYNSSEKDNGTYVISFDTEKNKETKILKFDEEDNEAFTYFYDTNLYTNIGKNVIYGYNFKAKKKMSFKRSASMPKAICRNDSSIVILNDNGSLSWANPKNNQILSDWYLTSDGVWYVF